MIRVEPKLNPADYADVVLDDGAAVESEYHDVQRSMLMDALKSNCDWLVPNRAYKAMSNVGIFRDAKSDPICPDALLSLDIAWEAPIGTSERYKHAYFYSYAQKAPEVVVEISSLTNGHEHDAKLARYAALEIRYCVVFDPQLYRRSKRLRVFELTGGPIREIFSADEPSQWIVLEGVGIGVTIWSGDWGHLNRPHWLRWCYPDGRPLPLDSEKNYKLKIDRDRQERMKLRERAAKLSEREAKKFALEESHRERIAKERERSEKEYERAEKERERAEKERAQQEAEALRARLRALGINPD